LFNLQTGQVLWQRNAYKRLPIASLTKMMTALVTVRAAPPGDHVLVTKAAVDSNGSKVGVLPLHKDRTARVDALRPLAALRQRCRRRVAQPVAGSVSAFVRSMNEEAARLGMACTRYSSPSGYFDQGKLLLPRRPRCTRTHVVLEQRRIARVVHTYSACCRSRSRAGSSTCTTTTPC